MSDSDNNENVDSPNDAEGTDKDQDVNNVDTSVDEADKDTVADDELDDNVIDDMENADELREKLKAKNKQNQRLYDRAKKAEGWVKKDGKWVKKEVKAPAQSQEPAPKTTKLDYGQKAYLAATHGIKDAEDISFVETAMKNSGQTLEQVLSDQYVLGKLKQMQDERITGNATNTGKTRRGSATKTGDNLLEKAEESGDLPDSDEEMTKLTDARMAKKQKQNSN